jgi:hypothetical protein
MFQIELSGNYKLSARCVRQLTAGSAQKQILCLADNQDSSSKGAQAPQPGQYLSEGQKPKGFVVRNQIDYSMMPEHMTVPDAHAAAHTGAGQQVQTPAK